jgi:hypothetical protein
MRQMYGRLSPMDRDIARSVHNTTQTLFFPSCGVFRGLAKGTAATSICTIKSSFDFNVPATATGSLVWQPSALASANWIAGNATSLNPYATGTVGVAGPFNSTNPSSGDWRILSAQLLVIPGNNMLSQGGEGYAAYMPEFGEFGVSPTAPNYTRAIIDQLEWGMPFQGTKSWVSHWVPNEYEVDFNPGPVTDPSALYFYFNGGSAASIFRIDIIVSIEYVPSTTFRPFVERHPPTMHPDTYYYVDQLVSRDWLGLLFSDYKIYLSALAAYQASEGGHKSIYAMTQSGTAAMHGVTGTGAAAAAAALVPGDCGQCRNDPFGVHMNNHGSVCNNLAYFKKLVNKPKILKMADMDLVDEVIQTCKDKQAPAPSAHGFLAKQGDTAPYPDEDFCALSDYTD